MSSRYPEYMSSRYPECHSLDTTAIEMVKLHRRPKSADCGRGLSHNKGNGSVFHHHNKIFRWDIPVVFNEQQYTPIYSLTQLSSKQLLLKDILHIIFHSYMFRLFLWRHLQAELLKRYCIQLTMFCWVRDLVLHFLKYYEINWVVRMQQIDIP